MGLKKYVKKKYTERKSEYLQERAANKLIRKDVRAAALQERRKQAINAAKRKEKLRYAPKRTSTVRRVSIPKTKAKRKLKRKLKRKSIRVRKVQPKRLPDWGDVF